MRTTSLAAALALLIVGCGGDPVSPATPDESASGFPEPGLSPAEPDFAAATATATTNLWTTKAPMPTARSFPVAGVVNGVLYAVGGYTGDEVLLPTVEAYSAGTNSWTTKAPLPSARAYLNGAGTINGILYVAGGLSSSGYITDTLFAYTPSTNSWATKARMLVAGACGASGVIGGKLYVYTGCNDESFQRYDPATNSWKQLPLPVRPTRFPAAGVIAGKFYLAGGKGPPARRPRGTWRSTTRPRMPGLRGPRCGWGGGEPRER
jgi:hypothetical protein